MQAHCAVIPPSLSRDHEGPNGANEIILGRSMLDQCNHLVRPARGVVDGQVVAVYTQKMPHRFESRAFVGLLESVRSRNPGHQSDSEYNDVLFPKAKEILRPR